MPVRFDTERLEVGISAFKAGKIPSIPLIEVQLMSIYPEALAAHLEGEATTVCHCWRLTRRDGIVKGFTDHDRPLMVAATLFQPLSGFSATEARDTLGLAVDTVDVEGALSSDDISESDIAAGLYDDATVETLLVNWAEPSQFAAAAERHDRQDHAARRRLRGRTEKPRSCARPDQWTADRAQLRCRTGRCAAAVSRRASQGSRRPGTRACRADARKISRVSGLDALRGGLVRTGTDRMDRRRPGGPEFRPSPDMREVRAAWTCRYSRARARRRRRAIAFVIRAGCDKAFATCKAKFDNALNFQGFPHLPGNDAAYGYAVDGDVFDGGALVP